MVMFGVSGNLRFYTKEFIQKSYLFYFSGKILFLQNFFETMKPILSLFILLYFINFNAQLYPKGNEFTLAMYAVKNPNISDDTAYENASVEIANIGWNTAHFYKEEPYSATQLESKTTTLPYLQMNASHSLNVMGRLGYLRDNFGELLKYPIDLNNLKNNILAIKNEPNIAWWDMPEELRYWKTSEFNMLKNYRLLLRTTIGDDKPIFMYIPGYYSVTQTTPYLDYIDIVPASCYVSVPTMKKRNYVRWNIEKTQNTIINSGKIIGKNYLTGEKSVFAILEMYNTCSGLSSLAAKHDFWMAVACDVKGILIFSYPYHFNTNCGDAWLSYNQQISIFKNYSIDRVLLDGITANSSLTCTLISGPSTISPYNYIAGNTTTPLIETSTVKTNIKTYNGKKYLFMVNSSEDSVVSYNVGGLTSTSTIKEIFSGVTSNVSTPDFDVTLNPLEAKVFIIESTTVLNTSEQNEKANKLILYPNPNKGDFRINFPKNNNEKIEISVSDYSGRTVMTSKTSTNTISLKNIKPGNYFLSFYYNNILNHVPLIIE